MLAKAKQLAGAGDWEAADELFHRLIQEKEQALIAALNFANTLRARNRGGDANAVLADVMRRGVHGSAGMWAAFAEELIQSALWPQALAVIDRIKKQAPEQAAFLMLCYHREHENWQGFKQATALLPDQPPWSFFKQLQQARAFIMQGLFDGAGKLLVPFAEEQNPAVQKILARYFIATGNPARAKELLEQVGRKQPLDYEWRSLLALCVSEDQAGELLNLSLLRQPRQADALVNRARWHARCKRMDQAVADCGAALEVKPWYDPPVLLMIQILRVIHGAGQDSAGAGRGKATGAAMRYLDLQIGRQVTPMRLAAKLDLMREGRVKFSDLVIQADQALKKYPDHSHVLLSAGAALQAAKKFDRAIALYQKRLENLPGDLATRNNLAQLYLDQGEPETAISIWKEAIDKLSADMAVNLAGALQKRGDALEAESIYRRVLSQNRNYPSALRGLADVIAASGNYSEALQMIRKAIDVDPSHVRGWRILSRILSRMGDPQAAIQALENAETRVSHPLMIRAALVSDLRKRFEHRRALEQLARWSARESEEPEYLLMTADTLYELNRFEETESMLRRAEALDRLSGGTALLRFYEKQDRLGAARRQADQLLRQDRTVMKHYGLFAEVLYRQERYDRALEVLNEGLKREPFRFSLIRQKTGQLLAQEQFDSAITEVQTLIDHDAAVGKTVVPHVFLMIDACSRARRFDLGVDFARELVDREPDNFEWHLLLGRMLRNHRQDEDALEAFSTAAALAPGNLNAASAMISHLSRLQRYDQAREVALQILNKAGERPDGILILGNILKDMGEYQEARRLYEQGIVRFPSSLDIRKALVSILNDLKEPETAVRIIQDVLNAFSPITVARWAIGQLIKLNALEGAQAFVAQWYKREPEAVEPLLAGLYLNRELKKYGEALKLLSKLEKRQPDRPGHLKTRADILNDIWRLDEAIACMEKALTLRPANVDFVETLLNLNVKAGNFECFETLMDKIKRLYGDQRYQRYMTFFFNINCHPDLTAAEIYAYYTDWYDYSVKPYKPPVFPHDNDLDPDRRLRIGYVSPDFRGHVVSFFSEPLLMAHDREQFELFAFANLDPGQYDATTERFKGYVDHWIETRHMSSDEMEKKVRELKIDILVDLAGHTANHRLAVFVRKPAPVQASWIFGAGQTTGVEEIDYLLCDSGCIPEFHEKFVTEKVLRLPFSGLPYRPPDKALSPAPLPCLQNGYITFGVLSRPVRSSPAVFAVWAEILARVPDAILRFDHVPYAEKNIQDRIKKIFQVHGTDADRLIFKNTRPHWQAYREIDIYLDTFPAGSGSTSTESLWMERPVITILSRPPMGRIAAVQLEAMGLSRTCTAVSQEEYVDKAVALAMDIETLKAVSTGMRQRMQDSDIMNYQQYAVEAARLYRWMWRRYCAGEGRDS